MQAVASLQTATSDLKKSNLTLAQTEQANAQSETTHSAQIATLNKEFHEHQRTLASSHEETATAQRAALHTTHSEENAENKRTITSLESNSAAHLRDLEVSTEK